MFDRQFFGTILQEHVRAEVSANPGKVPVIELHLVGGGVLDLCHVVRLADAWLAVEHYTDEDHDEDTGIAFLPYTAIARVMLVMRDEAVRQIGFTMATPPIESPLGLPVQVSPGAKQPPSE